MKKIFGIVLAMLMFVSPIIARAVSADDEEINIKKYNTLGFKEILAQESIEEEFKNYSETDDQITIYLFRGNGCGYCQRFLKFMNSITDEYGKYFKVVGFEVWNDAENSDLLTKISDFMGEKAGGVPYIIIGDQVFPGYAEQYNDGIKSAIKTLYDTKASDRYDVFKAYNEAISDAKQEEFARTNRPIVFNAIFAVVAVVVICFFVKKQNDKLLNALKDNRHSAARVETRSFEREDSRPTESNKRVVRKDTRRRK